jgi:hypothetical protein
MKFLRNFFIFQYSIAPVIFVPIWAYLHGNWIFLLGILFSYLGTYITVKRGLILLASVFLAVIFTWIFNGFHLANPYFFFMISYLWGSLNFIWGESFIQESEVAGLDDAGYLSRQLEKNKEEIQQKINEYLKDSSGTKTDYEAMDATVTEKQVQSSGIILKDTERKNRF